MKMAKSSDVIIEAMSKAHSRLMQDISQVEQILGSPLPGNQRDVHYELARVRKYLTEHFRLEEVNGYMDVVRQQQPRFERAIQHLHDEHRELTRSLDALIEGAEPGRTIDDSYRVKVQEFIDRLRRHETKEDELVQDAFTVDIGTKD
jgi:hypothetical protein